MPFLIRVVLLAVAFGLGTWTFGWWAVPAVAAIWGLFARGASGSALTAALAAMLGWVAILGVDAFGGRVGVLLSRVAPLFQLPSFALLVATLVLAALLAWSSAAVAGALAAPRMERKSTLGADPSRRSG